MVKSKKLSAKGAVGIVFAALLAVALIAGAAWVMTIAGSDVIYPNVYVAGVNLGGMTEEEATAAIDNYVSRKYGADDLHVVLPDREEIFTPETIGAKMDTQAVVASAMEFGRNGGAFTRFVTYKKAEKAKVAFTVTAGVGIDETAVRAQIADLAKSVYRKMRECSYNFNEDTGVITVIIGQTGVALDEDALYDAVRTAVLKADFNPISFDYKRTLYPAVDLSKIYHETHKQVSDAFYDKDTHQIVPEEIGYGFDVAAVSQQILMAKDNSILTVQLEEIQPNVTKAELDALYFSETVGYCKTSGLGGNNRKNNIRLACEALNGTVIEPGEVFSYNQCLGQRTEEKGYKSAGAYVSGKVVSEIGGGICQVSSTLYNCALLANLEIVARSEHYYAASYVELGLDATVSWGGPDFQFRNNTDYPIRIEAEVSGGNCIVKLMGTPTGYTVKMSHTVLAKIPYTTVVTKNKSEVNDHGRNGYRVATYRSVYDADGNLVSKTLEAYSYYKSMDIVVLDTDLQEKIDEKNNTNTD